MVIFRRQTGHLYFDGTGIENRTASWDVLGRNKSKK